MKYCADCLNLAEEQVNGCPICDGKNMKDIIITIQHQKK